MRCAFIKPLNLRLLSGRTCRVMVTGEKLRRRC